MPIRELCWKLGDAVIGVVQSERFVGYTESGQSRANQGIPRFACNPDLNHAKKCSAWEWSVAVRYPVARFSARPFRVRQPSGGGM